MFQHDMTSENEGSKQVITFNTMKFNLREWHVVVKRQDIQIPAFCFFSYMSSCTLPQNLGTKESVDENEIFGPTQIEYDYKSQAPQFAYDCQSMALGQDQSTPRAIDFPIIGSFGAYDFLNLNFFT